jgi:hypothetical protein
MMYTCIHNGKLKVKHSDRLVWETSIVTLISFDLRCRCYNASVSTELVRGNTVVRSMSEALERKHI